MKNLPARKTTYAYTLPSRRYGGENKLAKRAVQGLVAIGASYIGLKIVLGVFGFIVSAASFLLPVGVLSAAAYGGWQWLKRGGNDG